MLKFVRKSIARRLAFSYALLLFFILAAIGISLYISLRHSVLSDVEMRLYAHANVVRELTKAVPLDSNALKQEIETEPLVTQTDRTRDYSRLLDKQQVLLVDTPGINQLIDQQELTMALANLIAASAPQQFRLVHQQQHNYLLLSQKIRHIDGRVYYLQTMASLHHQYQLLAHYRRAIVLVIGIAIILAIILGIILARHSIRPIKQIACQLQGLTVQDLQHQLPRSTWPAELLTLVDAYNAMCARLDHSFQRLQQFSADLAHELRTPINNLLGQTEVQLSQPRTVAEYESVLTSNIEEFHRLAKMINELLFLAKVEDPQITLNLVRTQLAPLVRDCCDFYAALADDKKIQLIYEGELALAIDPDLFKRALINLLGNAINYSHSQSVIRVQLTKVANKGVIMITDQGIGIAKTELPKLFDRFYRADQARQQHQGGSGLGLSIVATIVALHHGHITIDSTLGQGTAVKLVFPLA